LSKTLYVLVSNVTADDHGNAPASARSVAANNEPLAGKIEIAGDKDVFRFTTLDTGTTYVRVNNLSLGMKPKLRVLGPDGTTVLAEARLDASFSVYPFIPLVGAAPGTVVYAEVSEARSTASGGLYELSAGHPLASDAGRYRPFILLPFISRD
jgi:hypothetical protein